MNVHDLPEIEAEWKISNAGNGFENNLSVDDYGQINPVNFSTDSGESNYEFFENKDHQLQMLKQDGDTLSQECFNSGDTNLKKESDAFHIDTVMTPSIEVVKNSEKTVFGQFWDLLAFLLNLLFCFPFSKAKTDLKEENAVEKGIDILHSEENTTVSKFNSSGRARLSNSNHTVSLRNIKTLEDSFTYFQFVPNLQMLEKSLEDVRKSKKTAEDHNSLIKRLEKCIVQRSKEHHPDKVQSRGGSEEELLDAHTLQTILNSTKKAMSILNNIFIVDIYVDHKYGYYTNLDISQLGNEDEIESQVYEVLFKISLISEIKQRHIVSETRKFLTESQSCIKSYIEENIQDFEKYLSSALFRLKQCIRGYEKLLRELEEVEEECNVEKQNICSLILEMRNNFSKQLGHLEKLLEVADLCLEGTFQIFICPEKLDDYFVCPFVCYINVIIMCSVFVRKSSKSKWNKIIDNIKYLPAPVNNEQTNFLTLLYYLASYYFGCKDYESAVKKLLKKERFLKESVKKKFLEILLEKNGYLIDKFKIEEYNESSSKRFILEELRKCKQMMSEFEEKKKELAEDIAFVKKSHKEMSQQVDKLMSDCEERRKEYEACLAENSELQARFALSQKNAEVISQQSDKKISVQEEFRKSYETRLVENSEFEANVTLDVKTAELMIQQSDKKVSDKQEFRKGYKSCLVVNSEFEANVTLDKKTAELLIQ